MFKKSEFLEMLEKFRPKRVEGVLGVSLYPTKSSLEDDLNYLQLAASYGVKKVFTALLGVQEDQVSSMKERLIKIGEKTHELGMELVLDVNPIALKVFGIVDNDFSQLVKMNVTGIRLDMGNGAEGDALLTHNPEGLNVEINASMPHCMTIAQHNPNFDKLVLCHNYYPQAYTGLGYRYFKQFNDEILPYNVPIAAFVATQNDDAFGPWVVSERLVTLEMHRQLSLDLQARHFAAMGSITQILIGDAFATESELKALSSIEFNKVAFNIDFVENIPSYVKEIVYADYHLARGDMSDYMARSIVSRFLYQDEDITAFNTVKTLMPGDVAILNDQYGQYKGELQVILKEMPNAGKHNVIGRIPENELFLLDYLTPNKGFKFI